MRLKAILQNVNLLNIILISLITVFVAYGLFPALDMNIKYMVPPAQKITDAKEEPVGHFEVPSLAEYSSISEENLFHPERKIPAEKKEEAELPKPEFVLYGTLITDDLSLAYVEDLKAPRNSPGRGKRQIALKKGDTMSGYTLKEIETDKIVMLRGEEKIVVPVNDPAHPKERKETGITATPAKETKPQATPPRRASSRAQTRPQNVPSYQRPDIKSFKAPAPQYAPDRRGGMLQSR